MGNIKNGLNMGALSADFDKRPAEVLRELARVGYQGFEVTRPLPFPASEFNALANELDFKAISLHTHSPSGDDELKEMIEFVQAVDCTRIMFGGFHPNRLNSADDYKRQAEAHNNLGEKCGRDGIRAIYHNHHWELKKYGGKCGLDIMLEETNPEWVQFEFDVVWLAVGGADPAEYIRKNAPRCPLIHYKDIKINEGYGRDGHAPDGIIEADGFSLKKGSYSFVEKGAGIVDFKAIREAVNPRYVEWLIVEQDNSELPPIETAKINFEYYRRLGVM